MTSADRFWSKVERTESCWSWTAAKDAGGYGRYKYIGRCAMAHRVSYEKEFGPIPSGLFIDHICRNRSCVRPDHLRTVTPSESSLINIRDGVTGFKTKTHCLRGHEFTVQNTYRHPSRGKVCKTCRAALDATRKRRRK